MKLTSRLKRLTAFLALAIPLIFVFTGNAMAETAACMGATGCHGDATLQKTIDVAGGGTETVPLYVNIDLYNATIHGTAGTNPVAIECSQCHTDIVLDGSHGAVDQSVAKNFGGWARFSKNGGDVPAGLRESIPANTNESTRNYYSTAVAASCAACHTTQSAAATSAHATIYKLRGAHIDTGLTAYAISQGDSGSLSNGFVGEDYAAGNCNRCHAGCQSCHFKSTITQKNTYSVKSFWDEIQLTDKYTPPCGAPPLPSCPTSPISVPDSMSEYQMDRTSNIASHEFRSKAYFETDADGVCEACHIGFNRYPKNAYYWQDEAHTIPGVVKATRVKRHPQAAELAISGSTVMSPLTGGTNTSHATMKCADCHGTASTVAGNVHNLSGTAYDWRTGGDVQCADCHGNYVHTSPEVAGHMDDAGTKVACIGCHTFGLARDIEIANTGSSTSHEVFIDPETNEVRPVVWKNAEAIAWYSHNWQTLNTIENPDSCAQKCHYEGNLVGAFVGANGNMPLISMSNIKHPTGTGTPSTCATCHLSDSTSPANILANVDTACGQCHGGSAGTYATKNGAPYMSVSYLSIVAVNMHMVSAAPVAAFSTSAAMYKVTLVDASTAGSSITVNWGDGQTTSGNAGDTLTHTYATAGTFNILLTANAGGQYDSAAGSVSVPQKFNITVDLTTALPAQVEINSAPGGDNDSVCEAGETCTPRAKFMLKKNGTVKQLIKATDDVTFTNVKPGTYKLQIYRKNYTFDCNGPLVVTGDATVTCTPTLIP